MTSDSAGNGFSPVPNDLPTIERMCEQSYTSQDSTVRHAAESALLSLSSSPRHLSQCTMILDSSEVCCHALGATKIRSFSLFQDVVRSILPLANCVLFLYLITSFHHLTESVCAKVCCMVLD